MVALEPFSLVYVALHWLSDLHGGDLLACLYLITEDC
jgi:hypothetical protein